MSRSIFPVVNEQDRAYFGRETRSQDQVGFLDGGRRASARRTPGSRRPWSKELAEDEAVAAADTLLLTVPNQLGVDYNAHVLEAVVQDLAPALGWR